MQAELASKIDPIIKECKKKLNEAEYQFKRLAGFAEMTINSTVKGVFGYKENEDQIAIPQPFNRYIMKDQYWHI